MMKRNGQLHLFIETELLDSLKENAMKRNITLSEYCRRKLREGDHFEEIKILLNKIANKR